ncbi:MAG: type II toxin-antitoxin system HicA family toxin [Planctomycetaceae bacterium]|nr:type II toxin-antitoxin system HicA family toxin [Planctomycetaceae bacterium]
MLRGGSDANIAFLDLCALLKRLGFEERTRGSHHVFRKAGVPVMINLQSESGKAKPCQVRQVRRVITEHRLAGEGSDG